MEHFSTLELTVANLPEDELRQDYEFLIKKSADDSGHPAAEFYTNRTVAHLMTEMLDVQPGESVYDPTCDQMPTSSGIRNPSARLLSSGTVVFCRTASIGLCSIMGMEMAISQDFANFVCGPDIKNEYLYHLSKWMNQTPSLLWPQSALQPFPVTRPKKRMPTSNHTAPAAISDVAGSGQNR
jgi:hypothetical protein